MKKKIFFGLVLCCVLSLCCVFDLKTNNVATVYAETSVATEITEPNTNEEENPIQEAGKTLIDRIYEMLPEVLAGAGTLISSILAGFVISLWKRRKSDSLNVLTNTDTMSNVVGVLNEIIGAINTLQKTIEKGEKNSAEKDAELALMKTKLASILEMLRTAYSSSNLPQAIKDMINVHYVKGISENINTEKNNNNET